MTDLHKTDDSGLVPATPTLLQEQEALLYLVRRYENSIRRYLETRTLHSHDTDDLFQEIVAKLWENRSVMKNVKHSTAWLFKIVCNTLSNFRRDKRLTMKKHQAYQNIARNTVLEKADRQIPDKEIARQEDIRLAKELMHSLPEPLRDVYYFFYMEGFDYSEIADILDLHENTVRKRLKKANMILNSRTRQFLLSALTIGIDPAHTRMLTEQALAKAMAATGSALETGQAGAQGFSMSHTFFSLALPFFWIMSLLMTGRACGMALLDNAPSARVRAWLTKHFVFFYTALVCSPLTYLPLYLFFTEEQAWRLLGPLNWSLFAALVLYLVWLREKYRTMVRNSSSEVDDSATARVQKPVVPALVLSTLAVSLTIGILTYGMLWPYVRSCLETGRTGALVLPVVTGGILASLALFHIETVRCFLRLLAFPGVREGANDSGVRPRDLSPLLLVFCACFTLVPSLLHLALYRTRPLFSVGELVVFGLMWLLVYVYNRRHEPYREFRIACVFLVQWGLMQLVRDILFP